ncbi:MAG: zinc finger Ran-binding domain-containing protein [Candidatus Woesearchaeota archaeon]
MKKRVLFAVLLFLVAVSTVSAVDHLIVNSEDWRDVYSAMVYSNLMKVPKNFLVSDRHSRVLAQTLDKGKKDLLLVSSRTVPFVVGYSSVLQGEGFTVEEISPSNINLELARRTTTPNFIVVDDSYGYNAVAVAPYAAIKGSYVIFADRRNIADVVSLLQARTPTELILYGHVDREVKSALDQFNPIIINKEDRFDNNIEIVKLYQQKYKSDNGDINKQVVLTNGEFLEEEVMSGSEPVLFLGKQNVPDQIRQYISASGLEVAVLIGNQYVGAATNIRRQIGISVFVKFARGARMPSGPISPVEGLDIFYVPTYSITLQIASIRYNYATANLEVTIQNSGEVAAYFKGSYSLSSELGGQGTVGDLDPVFIDAHSVKTLTYSASMQGQNLSGDAYVLYGESPRSLESELRQRFSIEGIRVIDNSQIDIVSVVYDLQKGIFYVEVRNTGETDVFVDIELIDVIIDGERYSFGSTGTTEIKAGKSALVAIRPNPVLAEVDLADNPKVIVQANYGERKEILVKSLRKELPFTLKKANYIFYGAIIVILAVLLLLLFLFKRKRCPECGHINKRSRHTCEKCQARLR